MGWYDAGVDVNVKGEGKVEDKEPVHLISGLQRGPARAALTASQETQLQISTRFIQYCYTCEDFI